MAQHSPSDSLAQLTRGRSVFSIFAGMRKEAEAKAETEVEELLRICKETIQKSAEQWSTKDGSDGFVINRHQCDLLINRLLGVELILADIQERYLFLGSQIFAVLVELFETLLDAEKLIKTSWVAISDWPRAAIEQGDMKETFSKLLYKVKWCTNILVSILIMDRSAKSPNTFGLTELDCDGKLGNDDEYHLLLAMDADEKSLKDHLMSVKLDDPTKKGLADQLCEQMEASPADSKLLFLHPEGFDRRGRVIGRGAFGTVQEATYLGSCPCAMKVISAWHPTMKDSIQKELDVIQVLGYHPHLVRLFCHSQDDESFYLIMEKMDMDLAKALVNKDPKLPIVEAVSLMLQIAEGVKYIHSKNVAHRDLKVENVLVKYDTSSSGLVSRICSVKVADFGLSKTREASKTCSNQTVNMGSSWYMAPEVIKIGDDDPHKAKFNPRKADVYSFAIMCAVILNGKHPYDDCAELGNRRIKSEVKEGKRRPTLPADCPRRLEILIRKCWIGIPSIRPLFDVICRELRYIKGLLLRGDMEHLANGRFEALELDEVDGAKIQGPWGGVDGSKFMDMATSIRGIKLIFITGKYAVMRSMEVTYELFGTSFTRTYGDGRYGAKLQKKIILDQCEFITCISGVTCPSDGGFDSHTCVKSLTIHTNLTSYGPFGEKSSEKDTPFTSSTGTVIGFHGAAAFGCLHSIGVVIIPDARG